MTRIALLPENDFVTEVKHLAAEITALKNRQFMGLDITTIKRNQTSASSDKTVPGSDFGVMFVDFTSDNEQFPVSVLRFSVFRGSVGTLADPASYSLLIQDATFDNIGLNSFVVNINNFIGGNLLLKAYVLGTDTGEVIIT